jgi:UrcA family protein
MKTLITLGLIGTLLTVTATPSRADTAHYPRSAIVYVADLDLTQEPDARTLYRRIAYAARSLCTAGAVSFDPQKQRHWRDCVSTAVGDAVERANAPLLMAIHLQRSEQLARL